MITNNLLLTWPETKKDITNVNYSTPVIKSNAKKEK